VWKAGEQAGRWEMRPAPSALTRNPPLPLRQQKLPAAAPDMLRGAIRRRLWQGGKGTGGQEQREGEGEEPDAIKESDGSPVRAEPGSQP